MKITSRDIIIPDKIIAGSVKVLSGLLFYPSESTCASLIMNTIGKVLFKDKSRRNSKEQKILKKLLKHIMKKMGTDLSIYEYNKFNATWYTKLKVQLKSYKCCMER